MSFDLERIGAAEWPAYWDVRYSKNVDKMSKKQYSIKIERDVYVKVSDGTKVCLDVIRPDDSGKFPAIVTCSPYSKDVQYMNVPSQPFSSPLFDHQVEAGDADFFVSRGYVYVNMDAPGTGKSEGGYRGPYSLEEQKAAADVVDWAASQPWCTGKVGMNGISHFGIIQLLTAAQQPRHLTAIFPAEITVHEYDGIYNGGIPHSRGWYIEVDRAINNPVEVTKDELGEEEYNELVRRTLEDPDVRDNSYYRRLLAAPKGKQFFVDALLHPLDGTSFWNERSPAFKWDKIKVPSYIGGIWAYHSMGMSLGPPLAYLSKEFNVPKKMIIYANRGEYTLPYRELNWEILRWYDYWLKGVDTGILGAEPPIKILVDGHRFRYENEWPIARTKYVKFYLRPFGRLSLESEEMEEISPDGFVHHPPTISNKDHYVSYASEPFKENIEITGTSVLQLFCAVDQDDANFVAKVYDVASPEAKKMVQIGYLKASHRRIKHKDQWHVIYDNSQTVEVKPGVIYEYLIQMSGMSRILRLGHRLELQISSQNITRFEAYYHKMGLMGSLPSGRITYYKIFRDMEHSSHIEMPVIPFTDESQWLRAPSSKQ